MKIVLLALASLAVMPSSWAAAQERRPPWARSDRAAAEDYRRRGPPPIYGRAPVLVCVPWCNADSSPCDPPVFKQADGRCNPED